MIRLVYLWLWAMMVCSVNALACDCPEETPLAKEVYNTKNILIGKVVKVDTVKLSEDQSDNYVFYKYTVKVKEWLKGDEGKQVVFYAGYTSCDYYFKKGFTYLLFMEAYSVLPPLEDSHPYHHFFWDKNYVSQCSRSALKKDAKLLIPHIKDLL